MLMSKMRTDNACGVEMNFRDERRGSRDLACMSYLLVLHCYHALSYAISLVYRVHLTACQVVYLVS